MLLVFSLTEAGEQQIGWVLGKYQATIGAVGKACHICQTSMLKSTVLFYYFTRHSFTKVTTFIIITIKNNYKNCYLGKSIWEGSLV